MSANSIATPSLESLAARRASVNYQAEAGAANGPGRTSNADAQVGDRRANTNTAILQAHYQVSLSAKDQPNALLFKTAIEAIDKHLAPELGENATQKAAEQGIDFSPQATADRIVGFATSLFGLYQEQHGDKPLETQLNDFLDIVGGGVDKGFGEAKDILTGLKVFDGQVKENAEQTYELIFDGFDKFKESVLAANEQTQPTGAATESVG